MRSFVLSTFVLLLLGAPGCASAPAPPAPGTSQVWGELRLVPRADLPAAAGGGSYGDRRLRDAELVDYSQPGFAVVYAESGQAPAGDLTLTIRSSRIGTVVEPERGAVGASGRILLRNDSERPHVVSYPAAGVLAKLGPGEQSAVEIAGTGEQRVYLLDEPQIQATVFAAPGPFAVVSQTGGFALSNLDPGPRTLHAWHPRFPPASRALDLSPDESLRVDFELGVGLPSDGEAHVR